MATPCRAVETFNAHGELHRRGFRERRVQVVARRRDHAGGKVGQLRMKFIQTGIIVLQDGSGEMNQSSVNNEMCRVVLEGRGPPTQIHIFFKRFEQKNSSLYTEY